MHLENRLVVARGGGGGESERDWELGVNGCKLLLLEWIYNEILLCSTENSVRYLQCSMTMGQKMIYTCMCNRVPLLYSGNKNKWENKFITKVRKLELWLFAILLRH